MSEVVLRIRNCRACGVVFCVCGGCDRGQRYCSPVCRWQARRQQLRAANRRHQRTDAGRRLHRMRQRDYRLRRAEARVTDHGFPVIVLPGAETGQSPRELCGLRSLQPMDRSVSRDSATAKRSWTATHGRQTFKNIRFQMIANNPNTIQAKIDIIHLLSN